MKLKISKMLYVIVFIFYILIMLKTKTYAASIGISIDKTSAYIGDTFTVTISGINGKVTIKSENSNISIDKSGTQFVDGSLTIRGTAKSVGTGKIIVTPIDVTTTDAEPEEVTKSASKSITIKEKETSKPTQNTPKTSETTTTQTTKTITTQINTKKEKESQPTQTTEDNFYIIGLALKGIKENNERVDIGLTPQFNKDIYEYTCNITADIQKIELEKEAGEFTNSIVVTGLEKLEEGENIITLQLAAEDHKVKTYTIKVIKDKQEVAETIAKVNENKQEIAKEESKPIIISMPLWTFIAMQVSIVVVEILVISFISWKASIKNKKSKY